MFYFQLKELKHFNFVLLSSGENSSASTNTDSHPCTRYMITDSRVKQVGEACCWKLCSGSVQREMTMKLYGEAVVPEGKLCLQLIRMESPQIATRWACHAWIALRHFGRCLHSGDFVQAIEDEKTLRSHVYKSIHNTKELLKDSGTVGRDTIRRFQREAISASPTKTKIGVHSRNQWQFARARGLLQKDRKRMQGPNRGGHVQMVL